MSNSHTSVENSSNSVLTANSSFIGTAIDVSDYSEIRVSILSDQSSSADGVSIQFSIDRINWDFIGATATYTSYDGLELVSDVHAKYVRVVYTNGGIAQTMFNIQTVLCYDHSTAVIPNNVSVTGTVQTTLTGANEVSVTGNVHAIIESGSSVQINGSLVDAFSRLRTSDPFTLFDAKLVFDERSLYWDMATAVNGTYTYVPVESAMHMNVDAAIGSRCVRQTKYYVPYQPGRSRLAFITGVPTVSINSTGVCTRMGMFDATADKTGNATAVDKNWQNGFFLQWEYATGMSFVRRSTSITGAPVDNVVYQADWNLDTMDGNGSSGIDIDPTKTQILMTQQEWLGVGSVWLGFVVNGVVYLAHRFDHANSESITYTTTASLPVRYEIENTQANATGGMVAICSTVISEGGFNPVDYVWSIISPSGPGSAFPTIETSWLNLRLKNTHIRGNIKPLSIFAVAGKGNANNSGFIKYELVLNGYTGSMATGDWTSVNSNSGVEYNTVINATGPNSKVIQSGFINTGQSTLIPLDVVVPVTSSMSGTQDVLSINVKFLAGDNPTDGGSIGIQWQEIY